MKKLIGVIGKIIFHKDMKRISSIILVFLISFFVVFSNYKIVKADTGQLIVDGSVGTGGLGSVPADIFPAGLLFTLGLKALDIEINLSNESLENGKTYTEYCTEQIGNWLNDNVLSWDDVNRTISDGLKYTKDGFIYFGNEVSDLLKKFGNWVISNTGDNFVQSLPSVGGEASATLNGFETVYSDNFHFEYWEPYRYRTVTFLSNTPVAIFNIAGGKNFNFGVFSNSPGTITYLEVSNSADGIITDQGTINLTNQRNGVYYGVNIFSRSNVSSITFDQNYSLITNVSSYNYNEGQAPNYAWNSFINAITGQMQTEGESQDLPDTFWGNPSEWIDNLPSLEIPEGYMGAIDAGILSDIQSELDQTKDYVIELKDYIKALEDAINETDADVPVVSNPDGTIVLVPDPPIVAEPEYERVQPADVPEDLTPVADPDIPAEPDELIQASKVTGLTEVFPFCIPFDLYRLFQKFQAEPVAPRIQIHWQVPGLNTYIDLDLDFSVFNNVAVVLRTMELVAAVVGLALVTRRIFLRS